MHPIKMTAIIERKRYSTETADLLAGDDYWDGNNFERHGRNTFLYKTQKGSYFTLNLTQWQGEADTITPIELDEAMTLYEGMREKRIDHETAFHGVKIEEA